jgi:site-specific DNA-methyltransferase (adenine-specific)
MDQLYYVDKLQVLREHIAGKSADLFYLDPPFDSKRDHNLLSLSPTSSEGSA